MKAIKYILFVIAIMTAASMNAQGLAQEPVAHFQSTSAMMGSGSTLPQAVYSGVKMASLSSTPSRPRRAGEDDGWEDEEWGTRGEEPFQNPVGELPMLLMILLLGGYAVLTAYRRREVARG